MEYVIPFEGKHLKRYSRHVIIPEMGGIEGHKSLRNSKVVIIGAGGLGCPLSTYLASAGTITIVDFDTIDLSNLSRQIAYTSNDIGKLKVVTLSDRLKSINPHVNIETYNERLSEENYLNIINGHDVIADCTDNVATRYLINEASVKLKIPLVSASAIKWEGQLTVYGYFEDSPCYRCLFPTPPDPFQTQSCDENGILGPVTGVLGSMQAIEVIKVLLKSPNVLSKKLLIFNGLFMDIKTVKIRGKCIDCPSCSSDPEKLKKLEIIKICHRASIPLENRMSVTIYRFQKYGRKNLMLLRTIWTNQLTPKGNLSNRAADILIRSKEGSAYSGIIIKNVVGGLDLWSQLIDPTFPRY